MEKTKDAMKTRKEQIGNKAATVGLNPMQFMGPFMTEIGRYAAAIVGFCAALAVASFGTTMAWGVSGLPADHPFMIVTAIAAHVTCLWSWWQWTKSMWKRFSNLNPIQNQQEN